jgi:hypothetical protein
MEHPDFIEIYDDALDADTCRALIERFEASGQAAPGRVGSGVMPELKDSRDIMISGQDAWRDAEGRLNQVVFQGLKRYLQRYPYALIAPLMLQIADPDTGAARRLEAEDLTNLPGDRIDAVLQAVFRPGGINLQRYTANQGGYPYWHCEHYPRDPGCESLHRTLLWTIYLNDGFSEGETEFLYQKRLVRPRTGSLLIAPAAFTHTHRGNRPVGGDKYIATSWVLFNRSEQLFGNG